MDVNRRYFLRLFSFCIGRTMDVLSYFIDTCVLNDGDFVIFLDKFKHQMFHTWEPNIPCCECFKTGSLAAQSKRRKIDEKLMRTVYEIDGSLAVHIRGTSGKMVQECLCKVSVIPGKTTDSLDIGLVYCILQTCAPTEFNQIRVQVETIRKIRNELAHPGSKGIMSETEFNSKWEELRSVVLEIARKISISYERQANKLISELKNTDINLEDINDKLNSVKEDMKKVSEYTEATGKEITESLATKQEICEIREEIREELKPVKMMLRVLIMSLNAAGNPCRIDTSVIESILKITGNIDEELLLNNLQQQEQVESNPSFIIKSGKENCIILELNTSPDIFQSTETFRRAIRSLITRIVRAGQIDTNISDTIEFELTFSTPLTQDEIDKVSALTTLQEESEHELDFQHNINKTLSITALKKSTRARFNMASSKLSCGPCGYDNKDAHKWCTNCQEGYCKDCEKMHMATNMSRDHKLVGIEDYLKLSRISVIQTCEEHAEAFESYCKTHEIALCLSCVLSRHQSCGDIIPLEDAAKNAKSSTALTDLEETISHVSVGMKNVQSIIQNTSSAHLDQQEKNIKEEIRGFRTKINNRLDRMEQNLILELESKLAKYRSKHDAVLNHMKESEKTIKRLKEQTIEMKKLASDLQIFLATRQINREVHECLKTTSKYVTYKYNVNVEFDPVLNSVLTEVKAFGNINTKATTTNVPLLQPKIGQAQIHVHSVTKSVNEVGVKLKQRFTIKKDSGDMMSVAGCTIIPDGQLLIADDLGKKQLMQYNQNGRHVRDIPVSSKPYDVTVIDSDRVAVSYYGLRYIEILNIHNTTVEKKVALDNYTWGLSHQGGKLYVVVDSRGIVIIELSGKIVNTLNIDVDDVLYVAATTDRIYYSDWRTQRVTCCDMTGKQMWKFQDDSVGSPCGLTVDNNQNVFVVGRHTNNVTIISRDGQTSKTLLTKYDGLYGPQAIYFNKDTGDLLVCNYDDTRASLFKVT